MPATIVTSKLDQDIGQRMINNIKSLYKYSGLIFVRSSPKFRQKNIYLASYISFLLVLLYVASYNCEVVVHKCNFLLHLVSIMYTRKELQIIISK